MARRNAIYKIPQHKNTSSFVVWKIALSIWTRLIRNYTTPLKTKDEKRRGRPFQTKDVYVTKLELEIEAVSQRVVFGAPSPPFSNPLAFRKTSRGKKKRSDFYFVFRFPPRITPFFASRLVSLFFNASPPLGGDTKCCKWVKVYPDCLPRIFTSSLHCNRIRWKGWGYIKPNPFLPPFLSSPLF